MFISKPLDHSGYASRQNRSCPASMSCIEILECRAHLANEIIQRVSISRPLAKYEELPHNVG